MNDEQIENVLKSLTADDENQIVIGSENGVFYAELRYGHRAWGRTLLAALESLLAERVVTAARMAKAAIISTANDTEIAS